MANNGENTSSPFTRPGFVVAAIVVAIVATLGITLAVVGALNGDEYEAPLASSTPGGSSSPAAPPETVEAAVPADSESICGLPGVELSGSVPTAPEAEWAYQMAIPYPTSATYGPASSEGVARTCYQHSPTGALFFAANALSQGSDVATAEEWMNVVLSEGEYRDSFLAQGAGADAGPGTRLQIAGYRILSYDGERATVDIAARFSGNGENIIVSAMYYLVWENGDWKIDSNIAKPMDAAPIPDLAGYTAWGA
ncbi:hypothetical protein C5E10_13345 [Pseudoclavibacter sp. RFBG4]|uniref:hypothetical protein n=1 Tax=Pseudoclavibacter sp. RFBG4 TaxID=2080575 RepID=UPI000CE767C5|nr:hypothetical protein [Pseudoclavibacter sp. RFBG4]PPG28576.1 hypothetical protein C5E10_13345 [Pseudoclavibacter sp. RFBG4]